MLLALIVLQAAKGKIMSFEQYATVHHSVPYVLDIKQGKGRAIYFGIKHSRDPKDPQFKLIRKFWVPEKPNLIFNEDVTAQPHKTLEESIKFDGERGALAFWASKDHITLRSIDLSWRDEVRKLPITIPGSNIKMFYFLRGLQQDIHRPGAGSVEQVAKRELDVLNKAGLTWAPNSVADVDASFQNLRLSGNWRKPQMSWIDPSGSGPLNKIARALSNVRDVHMVQVLNAELARGKKIFAVVGASHVVMQQPALPGRILVISNR